MAGIRDTFGGNVDVAYGRGVRDLTGNLERGAAGLGGAGSFISQAGQQAAQAQQKVRDLTADISALGQQMASVDKGSAQWAAYNRQLDAAEQSLRDVKKQLGNMPFDAMEKGLGKVIKGLVGMNTSLLGLAFDFLIDSIKRVYELQERWTKAIGEFNMRIGGTTAGLGKMTKAAINLSGQLRGLTNGDISEAIKGFADFNDSLGRTTDEAVKFSQTSLILSRGFNLGWDGAGKLVKTMGALDDSVSDVNDVMKDMIAGANTSGVSVNAVAKDVKDASTYMARFGKEGQKTFVEGAAWVRKYGVSMSELQKSVEGMDMFDEAAKTASKLNTAFGTMINSMDQMLEDDPAKRLDMIRQQMLAQGMTYDKLTPKQRRYFSETMHLTEEQTAALLDNRNANESYSDFLAKAEKKKQQELNAQKLMQKQLQATATTMYAFGAAFDRVTVAIAKAIKPLLEVFGLAKKGDKDFTSFGQVMENITQTVIHFFESLAKNDKWMAFMHTLGEDIKRAGSALKDFIISGRAADVVGDIAHGMKSFYETVRDVGLKAIPLLRPLLDVFLFMSAHIKEMVIALGALKGLRLAGSISGAATGGLGKAFGGMGGKALGMAGKGVAGVSAGLATGAVLGGTGAMVGGALGGLAGMFIPVIGPLMGPLGAAIGKGIEMLFSKRSEMDEKIDKEKKKRELMEQHENALVKYAAAQHKITAMHNKQADDILGDLKDKDRVLTAGEVDVLQDRIQGLQGFGKKTDLVTKALSDLHPGARLTADELEALRDATKDQTEKFDALGKTTDEFLKKEQERLGIDKQKAQVELSSGKKELIQARLQASQSQGDILWQQLGMDRAAVEGGMGKALQQYMTPDQKGIYKQILEQRKLQEELTEQLKGASFQNELEQTKLLEKNNIMTEEGLITSSDMFKQFAGTHAGLSPDMMLRSFIMSGAARAALPSLGDDDIKAIYSSMGMGGVSAAPMTPSTPIAATAGNTVGDVHVHVQVVNQGDAANMIQSGVKTTTRRVGGAS